MKPLETILAKSINYGGTTLLAHTQHVVDAIEKFAVNYAWEFDIETAKIGAVLHDLGKAHPHFQNKISKINHKTLFQNQEWDFTHRHEISSLAFLPCFPKNIWNDLIDLIVAHHKSIKDDAGQKGILDLMRFRETIDNHLKQWEEWYLYGLQILQKFDLPVKEITVTEAKAALLYVIEYCKKKDYGFSPLRGLLMAADHFASAFNEKTNERLIWLFTNPDLRFYHNEQRINSIYPLSLISNISEGKHTLVVASTGAGKTDFLLRRCKGRVFYTLPFQASINAMYERIKDAVLRFQPNADIRLLHATSKIVVRDRIDEQILQPLPGSSVKVLTPHQLAAIIFGTTGYESVMLDLQDTDVILDEIHTYSDFARSMVLEIVKTLLRLNCRVHIGTATMPTVLYNQLKETLGGTNKVYEVKLPDEVLDTFDRHQVDKIDDSIEIDAILKKAFKNNEKVLVIFNTVNKAQKAYEQFQILFPEIPKMLIHSRFKRQDRVDLESRLKNEFNGDGSALFTDGLKPCLVISTQVVEVSLDISFDRMITECAPLDSLIQRFGRVNRKRTKESIGIIYKPVHVIKPTGNVLPYKLDTLQISFDQLPQNFEVLKERSLQEKIDRVYPVLETKEIDIHLVYRDGKYNVKELTNNRKSVIVTALEIESATCILESDREEYLTAEWEHRLQLEIPVNYRTIIANKTKYEQLQVGSYPFIIPQPVEAYEKFGLQLFEHDNFL